MNKLKERFGDKLEILAFPCNDFGFQEWFDKEEIINSLKHCRPGNGFIPKAILMEKIHINGAATHPFFKRIMQAMPYRNTSIDEEFENPHGVQKNGSFQKVHWSPAVPSDVIWNFEWFLVSPDGTPFKRYHPHPKFHEKQIEEDLEKMLA